ncbi:MAG: flagellar hook-associated protein FlgL [Caldimonas sp.]
MRISTANSFDLGVDSLTSRQADLSDAQSRLASGKRVSKASDDPAAAARAERALAAVQRSDTSQRSVDASRNAIAQTETAMGDAEELMQQAREALVASGNGSYSDAERNALGEQIKAIRTQLLQVANRTDGAGHFLFGGQAPAQRPFVDAPGGVQFAATSGQLGTDATTSLPLTTDGASTWLSGSTGNGVFKTSAGAGVTSASIDGGQVSNPALLTGANYTLQFSVGGGATTYAVLKNGLPTAITNAPYASGQAIAVDGMSFSVSGAPANGDQFQIAPSTPTLSVFDTLDKAVADLSTAGRTGSQMAQSNDDNLRNIDSVMSRMQSARSDAGSVLNRIDGETARIATQKLASQTEQSEAEDLDMVQAVSAFQTKQSGYDAALKSYAMVQRLSLFQYLGN